MQCEIAVLRFGLGAKPGELSAARADPKGWLRQQISGAVPLISAEPLPRSDTIYAAAPGRAPGATHAAPERGTSQRDRRKTWRAKAPNAVREVYQPQYRAQVLARAQSAAATDRPFAERLVHFWSNHFAVSADKGAVFGLAGTLENEAIRPHVNGRFLDMLTAVEQHPAMIAFLDNQYSVGQDSEAARKAQHAWPKAATQPESAAPVRHQRKSGPGNPRAAYARRERRLHPGGRHQLRANHHRLVDRRRQWTAGRRYRPDSSFSRQSARARREDFPRQDLPANQGSYRARPCLRIFRGIRRPRASSRRSWYGISSPMIRPPAAVDRVATAFLKSGGDLPHVYSALIDAPEAWQPQARKFKTPQDFVFSSLRALNVSPQRPEEVIRSFELLGQRQYTPGSPAGWPDNAKSWDGSDALMHRVLWAARFADKFDRGLDPVELAASSLGAMHVRRR
jgi:uncharacterized protein (DUF1800 family)